MCLRGFCHSKLTAISTLNGIYRIVPLVEVFYVSYEVENESLSIICMSIDTINSR
jgi:hypothetical protein